MAIASENNNATNDGAQTLAYPANVKVDSLLIAVIRRGAGVAPTSLTDTIGNTWTKAVDQVFEGVSSLSIWWAISASAGANTITQNGGTGTTRWVISEFSGIATSTPQDQSVSAQGTSTTPSSGATGTLAQADELCIGGVATGGEAVFTTESGWTELGTIASKVESAFLIVSATTAQAYDPTTDSSNNWACGIVTFKGAVAAAASRPSIHSIRQAVNRAGTY